MRILLYILSLIIATSCSMSYSFSGADIPAESQTFSVEYFSNNAPLASPIYAQNITESLKDKLLAQTSLDLTKRNGDLQFAGVVTGYAVQPINIQAAETAGQNRLTISVTVAYINKYDESKNFDKSFSRFADFSSDQDLSAVEESLIEEINDQLVQDIFNASVGNW